MHWNRPRGGKYTSESSDGHVWEIERLANGGRVALNLLDGNARGAAAEKPVAECASIAEARILAACLEHADDIELPDLVEQMSEAGLRELDGFPEDVADEIMENVWRHGPDGYLYKKRERRWFGNDDATYLVTVDEQNHFPVYAFRMGTDRMISPDCLYVEARPLDRATAAAFLFGHLEILKKRQELNGSLLNSLRGDQHHDLVDRFEDRFYSDLEDSLRI